MISHSGTRHIPCRAYHNTKPAFVRRVSCCQRLRGRASSLRGIYRLAERNETSTRHGRDHGCVRADHAGGGDKPQNQFLSEICQHVPLLQGYGQFCIDPSLGRSRRCACAHQRQTRQPTDISNKKISDLRAAFVAGICLHGRPERTSAYHGAERSSMGICALGAQSEKIHKKRRLAPPLMYLSLSG